MAWLNDWDDEWETFHFNHTTRAWPSPNEPRRFAPYWYPQWTPTVAPLMDFYLLRTVIDDQNDIKLFSSIQTEQIDERRFGGDTGLSPDGRIISVEVERFDTDVPGFQFPGIRWLWTYSRAGFPDDVIGTAAFLFSQPDTGRLVHNFDLFERNSYSFGSVHNDTNWTPQLDTDFRTRQTPPAWHWQAVASRTPVPNN